MALVATSLPLRYAVAGFGHVGVPAAVAGVAGVLGPVRFRFPSEREVTDLLVLPEDGTPGSLAGVSLEILDDENEPMFSDQTGDAGDSVIPLLPFAVPCLSIVGASFRAFPIQRFVRAGAIWNFTMRNLTGGIVRVASLSLGIQEIPR